MSATAQELKQFLYETLFTECDLYDAAYSLLTRQSFILDVGGAMADAITAFNIRYTPNAQDCDKYARLARWLAESAAILAQQAHRREGIETAPAVGTVVYAPDWAKGGRHCICFAIVREVTGLKVVFMEPQQPGHELNLSQNEIMSISLAGSVSL